MDVLFVLLLLPTCVFFSFCEPAAFLFLFSGEGVSGGFAACAQRRRFRQIGGRGKNKSRRRMVKRSTTEDGCFQKLHQLEIPGGMKDGSGELMWALETWGMVVWAKPRPYEVEVSMLGTYFGEVFIFWGHIVGPTARCSPPFCTR